MPGKPSRRDRKRRGTPTERRPRPAPAVSPGRIVRAARVDDSPVDRATAVPSDMRAPSAPSAPPAAQNAGPRGRGTGALRRGATTSARALEAQREERIRRDSIRDLRSIAIAAVITTAALIAVAALL